MSTQNIQCIRITDFLVLAVRLIAEDLKIQKHLYWLSLGGLDSSPMNLELDKAIFSLIGISDSDLFEEAQEWYFQKVQDSFSMDIFNDENLLAETASDILRGLDRFRMQAIAKNKLGSS